MESLWSYLSNSNLPIYCYGTGNGADKIIDVLYERNIKVSGIFASNDFVRNRTFRDFPVLSYSEVLAKSSEQIIILLAFGTTDPSVISFINELNSKHILLIPDVPLYGGELFDQKYYESHIELLDECVSLFDEERSRQIYKNAISYRLTGKLEYLHDVESPISSYKELFNGLGIDTIIDGGAYKGDSTNDLIRAIHPTDIWAVEADPKTYLKLEKYAESETETTVHPVCGALWNTNTITEYVSAGSRGSSQSGHSRRSTIYQIPTITIDSIAENRKIDLIKLDVEGAEENALKGAEGVLTRDKPNIAISLYHRTDDLFSIPLSIHRMLPDHRLILRRAPCIPCWDLTLYAIRQ